VPNKTIITAAAGIVAATGIVVTVASLANASTSTSPSAITGYAFGYGQQSGEGPGQDGARGGSSDTPVTGSELSKVTAAVKAKDATVTVTSVRKDPDGSYDVFGTKAGAQVMLEVSKDLKTIATRTGGPGGHGGHRGGPGGGTHTAVTGTELSKVTAAVKAKDSAVAVTSVQKDEDGSYDVFGTKAGAKVMLEVSKDLKTITARTGGPGGHGHGPDGDGPAAGSAGSESNGTQSNGTQSNGTASTTVYRTV
jgi:hypothetical protein